MSSTDVPGDPPHPMSGAFATSAGEEDPDTTTFEVLEVAPSGGMGLVVHARDRGLGREVAIKRARPDVPGSEDRLRREARVLGQLDHPGIVRVYAAGPDPDAPAAFRVVLDWVGGGALSDVLGSPRGTAALVAVADALAHTHSRGFVHRDLKPSNIRLGGGRPGVAEAVLIDWGLARTVGEPASRDSFDTLERRLTQSGTTVGTPGYMAPEQVLHAKASPASDVWAFGVLLWQHLTGSAPPDASEVLSESRWADREAQLRSQHGALGALAADCLQRDPALRPPDGTALVEQLEAAVRPAEPGRSPVGFVPLGWLVLVGLVAGLAGVGAGWLLPNGQPVASVAGSPIAPLAREAFAELAWQAMREGRDIDAQRWSDALDGLPGPVGDLERGLDWLPAPSPAGERFAVDCEGASLSADGQHLSCVGEVIRVFDARTAELVWSDRLEVDDVAAIEGGRTVLRSEESVLLADREGTMRTIARVRPTISVDVAEGRVLARTGAEIGTKAEAGADVALWRDRAVRTPAVWDRTREVWVAGQTRDVVVLDPESLDLVLQTPAFANEDLARVHVSANPEGPLYALGIRGELTVLSRDGEVLRQHALGPPTLLTAAAFSDTHIAIASEQIGIQVFELASGGLLGQLASRPATSLALDGDTLVSVEEGALVRRALPARPRAWQVPSLASGAAVDGWVAIAGQGDLVELAAPDGEPGTFTVEPGHVVKGITRLGDGWLAANTTGQLKWIRPDGRALLGPGRTHRDVVRLADGSALAIPYAGGPTRILPDGSIDQRLERPEEFVSATADAAGARVGLVTKGGDVFAVRLGADGADIDQLLHHPGARFAMPVDGGWLVLDDRGAWAYGPTGESLEDADTPGSGRRWVPEAPIVAVAVGQQRCVLGHRSGRVVVRDCASGQVVGALDAHTERIAELLLDPTETELLSAAWDDRVHRFELPPLGR